MSFVRVVVHQKVADSARQVGLFSAAYYLRDHEELSRHDWESLEALLKWFTTELPVPARGTIPDQAIFWYSQAGPFSQRMWELAEVVREYGFTVELITAKFIGRVVYRDEYQMAAIPSGRRHR